MFAYKSLLAAVLVAVMAGEAVAAPVANPGLGDLWDGIKENFKSKTVTKFDSKYLPDIQYYAQYSAASYCDPQNKPGVEIACPNNICPLVTKATSMTEAVFRDSKVTDTTGFVARDDTKKTITIVFRGSTSLRNWLGANANIATETVPYCKKCNAHKGFMTGMRESLSVVDRALTQLRKTNPDYQIVAVGHSLGGALATLTAARLRATGLKVRLFTYGAPRIGDVALSNWISESGENYRVTRLSDPVPRVPPTAFGYGSIHPEYHITTTANATNGATTTANDIEVINNGSFDVNLGTLDFDEHRFYLGPSRMTACKSGEFEF